MDGEGRFGPFLFCLGLVSSLWWLKPSQDETAKPKGERKTNPKPTNQKETTNKQTKEERTQTERNTKVDRRRNRTGYKKRMYEGEKENLTKQRSSPKGPMRARAKMRCSSGIRAAAWRLLTHDHNRTL